MVSFLSGLLLGALVTSCTGVGITGDGKTVNTGVQKQTAVSNDNLAPKGDAAATSVGKPTPTPLEPQPDNAALPVAVGGAYLTCSPDPASNRMAQCQVRAEDNSNLDYTPSVAYVVTGKDSLVTYVTLSRIGIGKFSFVIPSFISDTQSFGVGMGTPNRKALTAIMGSNGSGLENKLVNGGFEDTAAATSTPSPTTGLSKSTIAGWSLTSPETAECGPTTPAFDINRNNGQETAVEGVQSIYLTPPCNYYNQTGVTHGPLLAQTIKLDENRTYYFSFAEKSAGVRNALMKDQGSFTLQWGSQTLGTFVAGTSWKVHGSLQEGSSSPIRTSFQALGASTDIAALIDAVTIYDIGPLLVPSK